MEAQKKKKEKKAYNNYDIGYVHVDITEFYTKEGKGYLFVGIERTTRFVHAKIYMRQKAEDAVILWKVLRSLSVAR